MKKKIKFHTKILGLIFVLAYTIFFIIFFLSAYFNPTYKTILWINAYGEAKYELIVLLLSIIPMVCFFYSNVMYLRKEKEKMMKSKKR